MIIRDRVYGQYSISSKVLIELINSQPIQRLKDISQFGIPDMYYHIKNFSRYEHSVGVMLLLKKLRASEEEQIAGLLHDVSHTAFSHTIDWVLGDGKTEDYQDQQHARFVGGSKIPAILEQHGYLPTRIADYHNFGLLERDIPELCADRVDYSLREFPVAIARSCVAALKVLNGRIVFKDQASAHLFAQNFLKLQTQHWGGFEALSRYRIFANVLREALKDGTIEQKDFWEDDNFVMAKLLRSKNANIQHTLEMLKSKTLTHLPTSDMTVYKKFRHVDPLFVHNGKLERLSKVSFEFSNELDTARKHNQLGIVIPVV